MWSLSRARVVLAGLALATVGAGACSSSSNQRSSAGGSAGIGSGGAGGAGIVDPACAVVAVPATSPPYRTELKFQNLGSTPLYLHTGCLGVDYGISSCASGYRDFLQPTADCACACDTAGCNGAIFCGACPADSTAKVEGGQSVSLPWEALAVTKEDRGTFTCVRSAPVPAGRYRIAVRVYADAASATTASGGLLVTQDFELPVAGNVLEVRVDGAATDPCILTTTMTAATIGPRACTGTEAHDTACSLPFSMTYGADGGLTPSVDSSAIGPPAAYTLTRTYSASTMSTQQCMATIPVCTRDARVVTTSDLTRVLTPAAVTAAFGTGTPVVGRDSRPSDGQILVLHRTDGTSLGIGDSIPGNVVPPALADVVTVLGRLDRQMRSDPACASLAR